MKKLKVSFIIIFVFIILIYSNNSIFGQENIDLYPVFKEINGEKSWGYIDKEGSYVIEPQFKYAQDFQDNGLAIVETEQLLYGVIDKTGKYIVEPKFQYICSFKEGITIAEDKRGYNAINEKGELIFQSDDYISDFNEGKAAFSKSGQSLIGYINKSGKVIMPLQYQWHKYIDDFQTGKVLVKIDKDTYLLINENNQVLEILNYKYLGARNEGFITFRDKVNGKLGYIDEQGNILVEAKFSDAYPFKNGLAIVNGAEDTWEREYGVIDTTGNFILKPQYNDIKNLGQGLLAVGVAIDEIVNSQGSVYALVNHQGEFITDFKYYSLSDFNNGLASVSDRRYTFFIDETGNKVRDLPIVEGIGELSLTGSLIKAEIDDRLSYLTKSSNIVWEESRDRNLGNIYTIVEKKYRPNPTVLIYYPKLRGIEDNKIERRVNDRLKNIAIGNFIDINFDEDLYYDYQAEFEIEFYNKSLLVLEFSSYEYPFGAAHGMPSLDYLHIDLKSGEFYNLSDLFKANSDYVSIITKLIKEEIESQGEDSMIWLDEYQGIEGNQNFILGEEALSIYFYPYQIAPYSEGFPTFKIPYTKLDNIINKSGELWNSFN
ncbi:WG repeat-containing protein [Orenia marismortui]|uniref:WG repeat-containing protein n=1 Tax=Orenia marismortui TaxID=46469 RepID=UPI0003703CF0|nr:WG repeat-containing protein [Orenia marismortui]